MEKRALYPGTFDPFTLGHQMVLNKSLKLFDHITIAIGVNSNKNSMFPIEKRIELINRIYGDNPKIDVVSYDGLTVDYCTRNQIPFIIRGLRNTSDFIFEREIENLNNRLNAGIETIFLTTPLSYSDISSSAVREILRHGGNPMSMLPTLYTLEDLLHFK